MNRKSWTNDMLKQEASKYTSKKDFIIKSSSAYAISCRRKLIDKICKHMIPLNTLAYKDLYFIICDELKTIYIGISINPYKRYIEHCSRGTNNVKNIINKNHRLIVLEKRLDLLMAVKREAFWIRYFIKKNWYVANTAKAGSIGLHLNPIWDRDKVLSISKNYKGTITQFKIEYPGAYGHALRNKYREELFDNDKSLNKNKEIIFLNKKVLIIDLAKIYDISKNVLTMRYNRGDRDLDLIRPIGKRRFGKRIYSL